MSSPSSEAVVSLSVLKTLAPGAGPGPLLDSFAGVVPPRLGVDEGRDNFPTSGTNPLGNLTVKPVLPPPILAGVQSGKLKAPPVLDGVCEGKDKARLRFSPLQDRISDWSPPFGHPQRALGTNSGFE